MVFSYARTLSLDGKGNLYVGGGYTTAGGVTVHNVAKWNGVSWASLGTGTNNTVYVAKATSSGCYVGGTFTAVGDNSQLMTRVGYFSATVTASRGAGTPLALEVFPNPARGSVLVQWPGSGPAGSVRLTLLDALGRVVRTHFSPQPSAGVLPVAGANGGAGGYAAVDSRIVGQATAKADEPARLHAAPAATVETENKGR